MYSVIGCKDLAVIVWRSIVNKKFFMVLSAVLFIVLAVGIMGPTIQAQADSNTKMQYGNHNLKGTYAFYADGVVEDEDGYVRAIWETGRFDADGKGNLTNGIEYSSLLSSSDPNVIDQPFTFTGTYEVYSDGTAKSHVTVVVNPQLTIEKDLWFVIHSIGKDGIANGFAGGHADADLGDSHGNSQTHVGWRMNLSE